MPEVHPLYTYGPFVFIGASALASALLAPRYVRRLDFARHAKRASRLGLSAAEMPAFKPSPVLAIAGLGGTLLAFWGLGTLVCWLALAVAERGPIPPGAALPGATVDLFVIAHLSPPLSNHVARVMIERLAAGADARRFDDSGQVEERLAFASALDPSADEATSRYLRHGFRTRAGKVVLKNPSPVTCKAGLGAFADSLREGAVFQLGQVCRNVKGDTSSAAAFKIGDFRNAVGPETEAILSRLPFAPAAEPTCLAGGDAVPPPELPLCRLLHAEVKKETRAEILADRSSLPAFADRWRAAMRLARGTPLPPSARLTVSPERLLFTPLEAIADEPIGMYLDLEPGRLEKLGPSDAASIEATLAAHRSAFGDHLQARTRCDRALELSDAIAPGDRVSVFRLCAAVALRAGRTDHARELLADAPSDLLEAALDARDDGVVSDTLRGAAGAPELFDLQGPALLVALRTPGGEEAVLRGVAPWVLAPLEAAPSQTEWLREAFPACRRCDFHDQLGSLLLRRDAAEAAGDEGVLHDLEPIVARFRAVIETRPLGLVLRAGRAP